MPFDSAGHYYELGPKPRKRGGPALFLDRDGVIIEEHHYLKDPESLRVIPGVAAAVRRFREAGHMIVIVTNQSGIGRGLLGWPDFFAIQTHLSALLADENIGWDMVLACPHHPTEGRGSFAWDSPWRKPRPGMIRFAADALAIDLARSTLVGDRVTDLTAGYRAGVGSLVHVQTGYGAAERPRLEVCALSERTTRLPSLADLLPSSAQGRSVK